MPSTRPNILLVEDDKDHTEIIYRLFEASPLEYTVNCARTLSEARRKIVEQPPDLVISDIDLPDGKGTELFEINNKGVIFPFIFMTCQNDDLLKMIERQPAVVKCIVKTDEQFKNMPQLVEEALSDWADSDD